MTANHKGFWLVIPIIIGAALLVYFISRPPAPTLSQNTVDPQGSQIRTFCSTCHSFPTPDLLTKRQWEFTITEMYQRIIPEMGVTPSQHPDVPSMQEALAYYRDRAPDKLPLPENLSQFGPGKLSFKSRDIDLLDRKNAVSSMKFVSLFSREGRDLLITDAINGLVMVQQPYLKDKPIKVLAKLKSPARATVADLDNDGIRDLLVADLGSTIHRDSQDGSVVWLKGLPDGSFKAFPILENQGRIADVQVGDLDGDGDLDLAVCVFGWYRTGRVLLMINEGKQDENGVPIFTQKVLDRREGPTEISMVDIDNDGDLDLICLISQQHETIVAFINHGDLEFEPRIIFQAPHPLWGSGGIEVVDIDKDGDLDVLYVNGDTFTTISSVHSFQGVHWLENKGRFPFEHHKLATLPGAYNVKVADMDNDGDLDIVASAWLPWNIDELTRNNFINSEKGIRQNLDSLIWLEQTAPGEFQPHSLEKGNVFHPALAVGDYDDDGDLDILVGTFLYTESRPAITLFENQKK